MSMTVGMATSVSIELRVKMCREIRTLTECPLAIDGFSIEALSPLAMHGEQQHMIS